VTTAPLLRVDGVRAVYGDTVALHGVSMDIADNEFFALLGPSGCGKTTLLRSIAGFETPASGRIEVDGRDLLGMPPHKRPVNMMFQSYALFPHLSVQKNIAYGLEAEGVGRADLKRRVGEVMEVVGLTHLAARRPSQLSGGQRQRVALARAIVKRPRLLLLDEPLSALDRQVRSSMQLELKRLQHEVGLTFVVVTHDQEEAMSMADLIAVMQDGRIEQLGPPAELYEHPRTEFVAGFLGVSNLLDGKLVDRDGTVAQFETADGARLHVPAARLDGLADRALRVGVRPEKIKLRAVDGPSDGDPPNTLRGHVTDASFLGVSTTYVVRTDSGTELTVYAQNVGGAGLETLGPGREVLLGWEPPHSFVVAKATEESHAT
jgi:spermidine/putrescine ABC transporter ATP-binding subunit